MVDAGLRIVRLCCGPYQSISYLIIVGDEAALIDAGVDAELVIHALGREGIELKAVLLTHGHIDHVHSLPELIESLGPPVFLHPVEREFLPLLLPADSPVLDVKTEPLPERIELGGIEIIPIHSPGHTPGSVCYHLPARKILFTGDTLFKGAIGRVDLIGGDGEAMMRSLMRLLSMDPHIKVLPGHGEPTTIGEERARLDEYLELLMG